MLPISAIRSPGRGTLLHSGVAVRDRSAALVRAGSTLVTTIDVPKVQPKDRRAVFFVVEADRARLADLAQRLSAARAARLR